MRIEQENRARRRMHQQVVSFKEQRLVASDKPGVTLASQVGRTNRLRSKTQVRNRHRPRFFRVINEIALHEEISFIADDLDRILVGRHRAIRTQAIEDGGESVVRRIGAESRVVGQRQTGQVVVDAHREAAFRPGHSIDECCGQR